MLTEEEFSKLPEDKKREYLRAGKRLRVRDDLLYFCKEILGYREIEREVHGKLEKVLIDGEKRKLILLPRGSFKSTISTIGYTIWRFLREPDIRILIDSEVLENSQKFINQMKVHMRGQGFTELYGEMIDKGSRETAREFTIKARVSEQLKEPTVYATGIGTVNVGMHYDLIIADDLHSEKNVATEEQIQKVIAHYRLLLSLLEPGGEIVIIGTRWHFLDLYSFLLEEEIPEGGNWEVYIEKAIRDDGSLFFPQRLTREFLKEQRNAQGAYLYSCQYQNEPVSEEMQVFKKEFFRYWGKEGDAYPVNDEGKRILLNVYILIDRAFSSAATADYTGCVAIGLSTAGNVYVLEAERQKCSLDVLGSLINAWIRKYGEQRVRCVGVESINWEEIEKHFKEDMKARKCYYNLVRLVPEGKMTKRRRIEAALESWYSNKIVYHRKRMIDLEDELLRFPNGTHDDLIDALAYGRTLSTVPVSDEQEAEQFEYEPSGFFGNVGY